MKMEINLYVKGYKHLKDVSSYNYNFYEILFDYAYWSGENNIILEECHELYNYSTFHLGHFDENRKFIEVINWDDETGINSLIKKNDNELYS